MQNYRILIVEDEWINAEFISTVLKKLNHIIVGVVSSAEEAFESVKNNKVDLIFMDININGNIDGITCAQIINKQYDIPIIYTTAYADNETLSKAGKTNIYGYLIKPFDSKDIEAVLLVASARLPKQRAVSNNINIIDFNDGYQYNLETKVLAIDNKEVDLTKKEAELLFLFCKNLNQTLSFEYLTDIVWHDKSIVHSTIRDTVLRLRKKAPLLPLNNISGIGYRLGRSRNI